MWGEKRNPNKKTLKITCASWHVLWVDNFWDVLIASMLLYIITGWYNFTTQYEINRIYIYRKKIRKQDLINISTMELSYMLKGSARGKLESSAGAEPCGPTAWPGVSHPPHNRDHDQQRLPYHHRLPPQVQALLPLHPASLRVSLVGVKSPLFSEPWGTSAITSRTSKTRSNDVWRCGFSVTLEGGHHLG